MTKIQVTIISVNKDGKSDMRVVETESLLTAVRVMLSFKPKRGYKVVKTMTEEIDVLI